jgi:hypothetical protein
MLYISGNITNFFEFQNIDNMTDEELLTNENIGKIWIHAIETNKIHIVKRISSKIGNCPGLIDIAAELGHIEMIIWLLDNRKEKYNGRAIHLAAANSHTQVVDFLYNNLSYRDGVEIHLCKALNDAVTYGHLEVIKWIYYNTNIYIDSSIMIPLARFCKHSNVVNWLSNEICGR